MTALKIAALALVVVLAAGCHSMITSAPRPSPFKPGSSSSAPGSSPSAPSSPACTTSAAKGSCGPYADPQIDGYTDGGPVVDNNVWNPIPGWQQALTATGPGTWTATSNIPAGNTSVVAGPLTQAVYTRGDNTPNPLSGYSSLYSSFNHTGPGPGTGNSNSYDVGYDIWTGTGSSNNWGWETMIWTDQENRSGSGSAPGCADVPQVASGIQFGGSNGVPVQTWNLCQNGSGVNNQELIWYRPAGQETSGSVDILAMLTWEENHGYIPAGSGLNGIDYTFEICSTGGTNQKFQVNSFSITATRLSRPVPAVPTQPVTVCLTVLTARQGPEPGSHGPQAP